MVNGDRNPDAVWVAISLLASLIAAAVALALSVASGQDVFTAGLTAGGAFAGTMLLCLATLTFLRGR